MRADGTLWAWGINSNGQLGEGGTLAKTSPTQVVSSKEWSSFTVGNSHMAAVATDGTLWAWGLNSTGQLGLGDTTQRTVPTQVGSESNWSKVFCGGNFTVGLKTNGELWAWGTNSNGELGIGNFVQANSPVRIGSDSDWADAIGGFSHVLAVKVDGSLWAWGSNGSGKLGIGSLTSENTPTRVGTETDWTALSASTSGSGAMKTDGSLWIWGTNAAGQFGDGTQGGWSTTPRRFLSGEGWIGFAVGGEHALALDEDGMLTVAGPGGNFSGASPRSLTKAAESSADWLQLSGTGVNFHAVRSDGTLWAWGRSGSGQFGDGTTIDRYTLTRIGTESQWRSVKTGGHTIFSGAATFALKSDGTLWGSGPNSSGQLGDGTTTQRTSFVQIGTNANWAQFDFGTNFAMAVQTDGTLWGWGINGAYQLGQGINTNRNVPTRTGTDSNWRKVACGRGHAAGIRTDGSLWAWGANNFGQVGDGTFSLRTTPVRVGTATDWVDVACGSDHTMALKTDGSLWVWGNNTYGQLGRGNRIHSSLPYRVGTGRSWSQIAAGRNTSAVIAVDGALWTAGENHSGQCGNGETSDVITLAQVGTSSGWSHVAMGAHSIAAIRSDGSVWTAGTTGPRMLEGGRDQTRPLPVLPILAAQSIIPPTANCPIGQGGFRVSSDSGLPAVVRVVSGPASVEGDQVTFGGIGPVVIEAWQAGDANVWDAAIPMQFTVTITKNPASVTLDELMHVYDGSPKAAVATTNPSGKTLVVTYNGAGVVPSAAGSYTVVATIDDPLYEGSASDTLVIAKAQQTISFDPIADQLTSANVALAATGGDSGNPVTYSVSGPAELVGGIVTFTGAGSVTITANQAGNANYLAAIPVEQTFQVTKATGTVVLGNLVQVYDGTPRPVTATTTPAGKMVIFTYDGAASVPVAAGSYDVVGTIDDPIYQGSVGGTLVVGKASQTISFPAISDQIATAQVHFVAAGGGSGNPVTFTVTGPAEIDGGILTFTAAGEVTVTADQAGDDNHHPAPSVSRTFQVAKAAASVALGELSQTYDGTPRVVSASTVPEGLTVNFTYDSGPLPPINAGTYAVVGTIDDPRYAGSDSGTLSVAKAGQTIQFDHIGDQIATAVVNLRAIGGDSENPVTFEVTGGPAQLAGAQMSFTGSGQVTIVARQEGNSNFLPAPSADQTFEVNAAELVIDLSNLHQVADGTARSVVATTLPTGVSVTITYDEGGDPPTMVGNYSVVASAADPRYAGTVTATLVVDDPGRSEVVPGGALPALSALGELSVRTFRIGNYEITGSLWATVVAWAENEGGYDFDGAGSASTGDRPVTGVNWYDAAKWCNARTEWENALFGRSLGPAYREGGQIYRSGTPTNPVDLECDFSEGGFRLPTAAEWEFAARGGAFGSASAYPGGDVLEKLGWFDANSSGLTQPAGAKRANGLGLYDLAGNAAEWTGDAPVGDPGQRLLRGGAWSSASTACELSALSGETASLRLNRAGFRVVNSIAHSLDAALDHPDLQWDSGGDHPWIAQTGTTFDGIDAAQSGDLEPNQTGWLETRVEGPGNLQFRWKITGDEVLDTIRFTVDGTLTFDRSGSGDWETRDLEIPAGEHMLRWSFSKEALTGEAKAWLDTVEYVVATTPTLTTAPATNVTTDTAVLGGEVTDDGRRTVIERGVVFSTSVNPTLQSEGVLVASTGGTGNFTVSATGLDEGLTYHARAYATNNLGTSYGDPVVFTTDTAVAFVSGVAGYNRQILSGDHHRYLFALDGPRFVALTGAGGAALRAVLYDNEGNPLTAFAGDGDFLIEDLLYAGNYILEIYRESDGGMGQDYSLELDVSTVAATRPDVAVGAAATSLQGVSRYAPEAQSVALVSTKTKAVTAFASFANRGNLPDKLLGSATGGSPLFAVSYFGNEGNITASLLAGTYESPEMTELNPDIGFRAKVTPNKKKLTKKKGKKVKILKKTQSLLIRLQSTFDPEIEDFATITVQTR
ncbi:MAG: SUMF1/EgtB/PvdO family nonheme iron enzyme [Verrucomicrobiae bacterium]|nr:SUMF1/EgtB/PvdO family nonheme iron enzyme [Verrucomicrobiae bacterium]